MNFRIIFANREKFRVMDQDFNIFDASLAGRIRHKTTLWPVVGDYVIGLPQPGGWVLIQSVSNRFSVLERRAPGGGSQILAANVDTLFIVTSANLDLNLNRLERYAAMAISGGVAPVIVVNKIELAADPHAVLDQVADRFPDINVLGTSAIEGWNIDSLAEHALQGRTVAFVGSSGVGKSSLTNALLGGALMEVSAIREDDDRGRHTTTHRELHISPIGALVIDTPGLRTVGLGDDAELDSVFGDIEALTLQCKFTDCRHSTEPGCAINAALESGDLASDRWENYIKLGRELAFERRKSSKALQAEEKKKWAKIHMAHRERLKGRKKPK